MHSKHPKFIADCKSIILVETAICSALFDELARHLTWKRVFCLVYFDSSGNGTGREITMGIILINHGEL